MRSANLVLMPDFLVSETGAEKADSEESFEARQNAAGFFSVLFEVVMKNPELRKKVFNENDEAN